MQSQPEDKHVTRAMVINELQSTRKEERNTAQAPRGTPSRTGQVAAMSDP